ncbi:hypothetical protein CspHIS471_0703280 [Cutaneotrichosporon sp. HIS471]|nr:hypothetical protein CspHIS471_0703280 [Cutaneotrichosporon sp. HIS471]
MSNTPPTPATANRTALPTPTENIPVLTPTTTFVPPQASFARISPVNPTVPSPQQELANYAKWRQTDEPASQMSGYKKEADTMRDAFQRELHEHNNTKRELEDVRNATNANKTILAHMRVNNVHQLAERCAAATSRALDADTRLERAVADNNGLRDEFNRIANDGLDRERRFFEKSQARELLLETRVGDALERAERAEREVAALKAADLQHRQATKNQPTRVELMEKLTKLNLENDHLARRLRLLETELKKRKNVSSSSK